MANPSPPLSPPSPPRRAPSRPVNTCVRCQRLKIRCDHASPCGACVRAAAECAYGDAASGNDKEKRSGSDDEPAIAPPPRKRAVLVCTRCKQLKFRCDRQQPCAACVRGKVPDGCMYTSRPRPEVPAPAPTQSLAQAQAPPTFDAATEGDTPTPKPGAIDTRLEAIQHRLENLTVGRSYSRNCVLLSDALDDLAAQFPPAEVCERWLRSFFAYDTLQRHIPKEYFVARVDEVLARVPVVEDRDAPLLAMLAAALQVGRASSDEGTDLTPLMDQLLRYCERHGLYTADFVHAHLLAIDTQMLGGGSPFGAWLAAGKAHHAALMVGVHLDRAGETLFEQEMRRRLWWNIKLARHTLAARLQIHVPLLDPDVPRPLVISDAQLQSEDLLESTSVPEWAAIDARISFVNVLAARDIALGGQDTPLLDRFAECQRLLDEYLFTLPASLRLESATKTPQWGYSAACITAIATHEAMLGVYRPFFADANAGTMALALAVDAAHRLIATSQLLASFLMFEWVDNAASTLWSGAASVFNAGTVLVYALLSGSGDREKNLAALDTAVGVLRSHTAAPSAPTANAKAFTALEALARAIREGRPVDGGVIDPFSGQSVVLPAPASFAWDTLFSLFPAA